MLADTVEDLSIEALRKAYDCGERKPEEVLAAVMARIAAYDRRGVWIHVATGAEIAGQLEAVERARRGGRALPLYGIPFAVKDNIDVAGMPTTAACPAFSYVAGRSATAVQRLMEAGAICVGKTNLDQFATGLVGTRSPYGVCENAIDREWISGGSSSGSAVAVAGDLASFSLATDTAGSGRVPAAFNDLVGLKPTRGLISAAGVVPACRSLDCVAVFAQRCEEAEEVLGIAAGLDVGDGYSRESHGAAPPLLENGFVRVGVPREEQLEFFGNAAMAALFEKSLVRVKRLGYTVVRIDFSTFRRAGDLLYGGPWVAERLVAAGRILRDDPGALRPEILAILRDALKYSSTDAFEAQYHLAALRRESLVQWEGMDVLLTPTAGTIYRIAEVERDPMQLNRNLSYYTTYVNLFDLCGVAAPCGHLPSGLPMGVSFIAPAFGEGRVLRIGRAFHTDVLQEGS